MTTTHSGIFKSAQSLTKKKTSSGPISPHSRLQSIQFFKGLFHQPTPSEDLQFFRQILLFIDLAMQGDKLGWFFFADLTH